MMSAVCFSFSFCIKDAHLTGKKRGHGEVEVRKGLAMQIQTESDLDCFLLLGLCNGKS